MAQNDAPSSGPNVLLVAIIIAILMLGGGFAISYYILPKELAKQLIAASRAAEADEQAMIDAKASGSHAGTGPKAENGKTIEKFEITDLLVNISGTNGSRFLKASVFFEADLNVLSDLESKRPKITDIVAQTLSTKSLQELSNVDSRGKLRAELLATINPLLDSKGEVKNIYFPEFIIQ